MKYLAAFVLILIIIGCASQDDDRFVNRGIVNVTNAVYNAQDPIAVEYNKMLLSVAKTYEKKNQRWPVSSDEVKTILIDRIGHNEWNDIHNLNYFDERKRGKGFSYSYYNDEQQLKHIVFLYCNTNLYSFKDISKGLNIYEHFDSSNNFKIIALFGDSNPTNTEAFKKVLKKYFIDPTKVRLPVVEE